MDSSAASAQLREKQQRARDEALLVREGGGLREVREARRQEQSDGGLPCLMLTQ